MTCPPARSLFKIDVAARRSLCSFPVYWSLILVGWWSPDWSIATDSASSIIAVVLKGEFPNVTVDHPVGRRNRPDRGHDLLDPVCARLKRRAAYPVAATTGPQPKVEIDQDVSYRFGTMSQQTEGSHSWKITNKGEGDLELWLEGKTSCSCTIASLKDGKKAQVKPGESTTIDLEWNTKTFENDYSQTATIGTNDPSRPSFTLAVKGKVFPPVIVIPPQMITFGTISNEDTSSPEGRGLLAGPA